MNYNLEGRTLEFGKKVTVFLRKVKDDRITGPIISQLVGSATSVGANYKEANSGSSKRDFKNKISICRKEIHETKYWIEILAASVPDQKVELREIWKEANELSLIFNKIFHTLKNQN